MSLFILDDMIVDESESHENKRVKITTACDTCRRRKVKCDGASPCANCTRGGLKSFIIIICHTYSLVSKFVLFISRTFVCLVPIISTSRDNIFISCFNALHYFPTFTRQEFCFNLIYFYFYFF